MARHVVMSMFLAVTGCGDHGSNGTDADAGAALAGAEVRAAGRYWAELGGHGTVAEPTTVWFEYKPAELAGWDFVGRTPERAIAAGSDLATTSGWLTGLAPASAYDVRLCRRDEAGVVVCDADPGQRLETAAASPLGLVKIDPSDPRRLVVDGGARFDVWGSNYVGVTDAGPNQLIEDQMYDAAGLARIDADLARLENLAPPDGASNVIRMHLQLHTFLVDATTPDYEALARFAHVVEMTEDHGLRVQVTGLNYFYPADNPLWIAQQDETAHVATQVVWWNAMASALQHSPGVFAYDLMNEPYVGGAKVVDGVTWWTTVAPTGYCDYGADPAQGQHGICFGQFVSMALGTRTPAAAAAAWTAQMVRAIRFTPPFANDRDHLVTVGAGAFGLNNPFNAAPEVHQHLDFLSPHLYPDSDNGQVAIDLAASLRALTTKPIIAGETFAFGPVARLISNACNDGSVEGWIGQYDGRRLGDPCPLGCILFEAWYQVVRDYSPIIRAGACPARIP